MSSTPEADRIAAAEPLQTALFVHSPVASLISRISTGEIVDVNDAYCRLTGYRREEMLGRTTSDLNLWANPEDRLALLAAFHAEGHVRDFEIAARTRSGEIRSVVASFEPIRLDGVDCFMSTAVDITRRKQAEQAVAESESRFRHVTTMTNDLFYSCRRMDDGLFRVEWLGGNAGRLFGVGNEELAAMGCWRGFVVDEDMPLFERHVTRLAAGNTSNTILRIRHRDGTLHYLQSFARVEADEGTTQERLYGALQDVSERVSFEQRLAHLAQTDALTGLANRRHFLEFADKELVRVRRYGSPLSIAVLDLDRFKDINDTYGHKAGDAVLEHFAKVCRLILRESDLMGRIGGEEFAILFPETDVSDAMDVAERLREAVAAMRIPREHGLPIHVTVSIGVASFSVADVNIDVFMNRADLALYEAKRRGRNEAVVADASAARNAFPETA